MKSDRVKKENNDDEAKFPDHVVDMNISDSGSDSSYLSEKCGSHEDRENENPDQPRAPKRKNYACRDSEDSDKSKLMKKNSTVVSLPISETLVRSVTISKDQFADDNLKLSSYNLDHKNISTKDYFSVLPDEVLLLIFKVFQHKPTLVNCACVCRRWKSVAYDVDLWFRIELSQHRIEPGIMEVVLNRKPVILRMSQTKVISPIYRNIEDTIENMTSKLEYLDLSMASILPMDLELLLRTCHQLLKLSLEYVEVNEGVCREVAKNSNLCVLNLAQSRGLNESSLRILLTNCEKLAELHLGWTCLNAAAIKSLCQHVSKDIVRLNLSGCLKEMTDNHVSTLVLRCNKLKELDLSDATGISETSIQAICDNLNNLEILSLSRCYNVFPASYSKLFRLPSIAHLNIFGLFTESQIETLRKTSHVKLNLMRFSYVARPTVGYRRTSIWGMQVRD